MANGKQCPACGGDIGVWPVLSAGLPNRIRCPHCATRLTYREIGGVVLALLVVFAAVMAGAYFASVAVAEVGTLDWLAVFAGVLLGAWVLVELVAVWFLRNNRTLARSDDS